MKLIQTITLASTAGGVIFSSIPQTFTDLLIVVSARSLRTGNNFEYLGLFINNTFSGYSTRALEGSGSSARSFTEASYRNIGLIPTASATANTFGNAQIYIPNYTSSVNKTASGDSVTENNATEAYQTLNAFTQTITGAVTRVDFDTASSGAGFAIGSTFSLYGITKGSDGITTAS